MIAVRWNRALKAWAIVEAGETLDTFEFKREAIRDARKRAAGNVLLVYTKAGRLESSHRMGA